MTPGQLKGQLLLSRLDYVRTQHGPAAVERVMRALPDEERARVAGLSRDAWCPFRTLMRLDRAIADTVGAGDERIFVELGRASALHRTELLGEHVTLVSVHGFLSRMAEEHRRFHTFGRAEYRRLGFRHGEISFSEYPEVDPAYCLSGIGYLRAAIEQLAGAAAAVEEVTCQCRGQRECCYDLRWEER
jgi:uncharacterized protein (TIGR02265 family)